jgi:hypothetical protein
MKAKKNESARKPERPAPNPPMKKAGKIETVPEPEIRDINPPLPGHLIAQIAEYYAGVERILEAHAARLTPADRRHLNGAGTATMGFIKEAYHSALENSHLLPHDIPIGKFSEDYERFLNLQKVLAKCDQDRVLLWNVTLLAANTAYEDARAYYGSAQMLAKRKFRKSREIYEKLFPFFKKTKRDGASPAQKEATRDFKAVLRGKRDGEVIVSSVKPKVLKGKREVIIEE